ncbi:hypothetical protein [Paenibacillus sp. NAIST15-1]|uniref:hypothetical protein n=1 Tax=Paenibacillus sp. NAIST15-1 TaxID=1605994 RepID=UPI00086E9B64|nr:hypothetical protein [Paenibacillus sp. NAIST15-1]GAV11465.1 hypothetical protein PBN151_1394 [Paenibacillus sp. NAIST15-1]
MNKEASINCYDTSIRVWQDEEYSHPTLKKVFALLKSRGFTIANDTDVSKIIRRNYFIGYKGDLKFYSRKYPAGFEIEFYQEVNYENRNGGRYDSNKYKKMPYLIKKQFELEKRKIICLLKENGYQDKSKEKRKNAHEQVMLHINDPDRHWSSEKIPDYNALDKDKRRINNGDVKYFRDYKGVLQRGTVYHNINNMWWVVINKNEYSNIACFYLFDLDSVEENKIHKLIKRSGHHNPKSRYQPSEQEFAQFAKKARLLKRAGRVNEINLILEYLYDNNWMSRKFEFFKKPNSRLGLKEYEGRPFGLYRKFDEPCYISLDKRDLPMSSTESGWIRSLEKYIRNGKPSVGNWFCADSNGEGSMAYIWPEVRMKLLSIGAMGK